MEFRISFIRKQKLVSYLKKLFKNKVKYNNNNSNLEKLKASQKQPTNKNKYKKKRKKIIPKSYTQKVSRTEFKEQINTYAVKT